MTAVASEALWQDVECGAYSADLPLWTELASAAAGRVLELGAGTGRVALELAAAGLDVVAVDSSATMLAELADRARSSGLSVETVAGDARELALDRGFAAILAPMQLVHLLGGEAGRKAMLRGVHRHLAAGGVFAAALLAEDPGATAAVATGAPPLPDVREREGWVYSSLPIEVAVVDDGVEVRRLRQVVSPAGELREAIDAIRLDSVSAGQFESEARAVGLAPRERIEVPPTPDHVGSTICVLEVG